MTTTKLQQAKAQSIEAIMNEVASKITEAKRMKRTRIIYCLLKTHQQLTRELDKHTNYSQRIIYK